MKHFAKKTEPNGKINLFTGWVNPGDVTELKHLLAAMDVDATVLFEIESFDCAADAGRQRTSRTGRPRSRTSQDTANALGTIAREPVRGQPGRGLPGEGVRDSDRHRADADRDPQHRHLPENVSRLTGKPIPQSLVVERGIALDALTDVTHMFLADKRVAIYGNPDLVIGLAEFCLDLEMKPVLLLLGDDNSTYDSDPRIQALQADVDYDMEIVTNADLLGAREQDQERGS